MFYFENYLKRSLHTHYNMDSECIYTRPVYPKYPDIIKKANIRYALTQMEVKKYVKKATL